MGNRVPKLACFTVPVISNTKSLLHLTLICRKKIPLVEVDFSQNSDIHKLFVKIRSNPLHPAIGLKFENGGKNGRINQGRLNAQFACFCFHESLYPFLIQKAARFLFFLLFIWIQSVLYSSLKHS